MAKKIVKKASAKKATKTTVKKSASAVKAKVKKTTAVKAKTVKKAPVKRVLTDKEMDQRAANVIANTEKKNSVSSGGTKAKGSKKGTERPKKTSTDKQTSTLLDAIVEGMQDKKAKNIAILNLSKLDNRVCDFFVICDADSKTHVESIAHGVEDMVIKLISEKAYHSEGYQNGEWVLVDYINIVVHVFLKEIRD
jgi:ribosome-associated protein